MNDDKPKKFMVILGGGESGVGSAILARTKGFDVFLSDKGKLTDEHRQTLIDYTIDFEEGKHTEEKIFLADEIVKSPGIPNTAPLIQKIRAKRHPCDIRNRICRALYRC
jgi:UDP-N-acetylmuramoylalanine--D-glutamate ligase